LLAILEAPDSENEALIEERRMMRGVLDLTNQTVRELMSPRTDITAVSTDASIADVLRVVNESGFSRIPLYAEDIDHIVGVVYAKDLLAYFLSGEVRPQLSDIARPAYFVPETKRANDLLAEMRRNKVHLAIAVDEYGGTAGVVTVEDLLEEIVGEISDEYDTAEIEVQRISEDECIVDAGLALSELVELFGVEVDDEDVDTVGGFVVSRLGRLAVPGDHIVDREHGLRLRVLSVVGRRVRSVRIERLTEVDETPPPLPAVAE
jgi:CBS domain containing-hemolysin-like protein